MPERILPAGPCAGAGIVLANARRSAHDRQRGSAAEFRREQRVIARIGGVEVNAKQVERAAEALGVEIAVEEHQQVEKLGEVAPTMYLGMDGTGVPMRAQEVADRAGKQAAGSGKTREAKLVTIWTAESRDEEGKPVRDPGSITYSAAIESAATLDTSPEPVGLRGARTARGQPPRFHRSSASGSVGRWFGLDLEHGYGTIPASHSDSRPLSCQRTSQSGGKGHLWGQPRRQTMDSGAL